MHNVLQRSTAAGVGRAATAVPNRSLVAGWRDGLSVLNLRGNAEDGAFREAIARALGIELPLGPCTSSADDALRLVWAGPDDWFVIGAKGQADALSERLRRALAGQHHALTDVSSGYTVLHLSGPPVRDVLAQGCPLDLHPRVIRPGMAAGSHFFKASLWLWQTDPAPTFEALVRRSFMGYVQLMLERTSSECGLVSRRFA
jgi:sarcosine oxidase subunit gamma